MRCPSAKPPLTKPPYPGSRFAEIANEVNREDDIDVEAWDYAEMKSQVYARLTPLLSFELATCGDQVDELDVFELGTQAAREKDPIRQHAGFHLEGATQGLAASKCANLMDTRKQIKLMDQQATENIET